MRLRPHRRVPRHLASLAAIVAALASAPAHAGGLSAPGIGGGWSGASAVEPAAVYWNPARLAGVRGLRLQLEGALLIGHAEYRRERRALYQRADGFDFELPLDPLDVDPSKSGWAPTARGDVVAPSLGLFASFEILDGLTVGLGAYPAFAASLKLPDHGAHQWQLQEALILAEFITPAIGWQPLEWLQVGVGFDVVIGYLSLRKVDDLAETQLLADTLARPPINQSNDFGPDAPPGVRELDVLGRQTVVDGATGVGWSFKAGVTFLPLPELALSVVYQHSVDMVLKGAGYLDMDHDFFTKDLAFQGLQYPALVEGDAYVELPLPSTLRVLPPHALGPPRHPPRVPLAGLTGRNHGHGEHRRPPPGRGPGRRLPGRVRPAPQRPAPPAAGAPAPGGRLGPRSRQRGVSADHRGLGPGPGRHLLRPPERHDRRYGLNQTPALADRPTEAQIFSMVAWRALP